VGVSFGAAGGRPTHPAKPAPPLMAALPLAPGAPTPPPNNRPAQAALRDAEQALDQVPGAAMARARLGFEISKMHAKLGDRPAAEAALAKARAVIDTMGDQKYWEWRGLGQGYARLGDAKAALALAAGVPDNITNFRGNGDDFRDMIRQESATA